MERISQHFLEYIAKVNNISMENAVKKLDECIKHYSAEANIDYNIIYDDIHSFAFMSKCLHGTCENTELDQCEKYCHCVSFDGKCRSKYIHDAELINKDPDMYIKKLNINELKEFLKYASYLYYNYDGGGLTDNSFDAIEYELNKRLKQKGRIYEKIGADPVPKIRTKLPYPMMSLDKLKPESHDLANFLSQTDIQEKFNMVCSEKLDGVSGMIIYNNDNIKMYTRGNGDIGGDVSYLQKYIKLPKIKKFIVVRGEFIIPRKIWKEKYSITYSNPRSFVSAKVNQGYISDGMNDIVFIAYRIIDGDEYSGHDILPSNTFKILEKLGFQTPYHEIFEPPILTWRIINLYRTRRSASEYDIDGIVMSIDIYEDITSQKSNPEYTKAFKMLLEEQIRETQVIDVEWNISRHGRYIPVAIYQSVYINGIRLHRATAFNAQHIIDWHMGKGTKIKVVRSGDVIPQIKDVNVDTNINPILPPNIYTWHWEKNDIIVDDIENNPDVIKSRILYFMRTLGVPQVGEGRIENLYNGNLDTIKKITNASIDKLQNVKGFGKKLSEIFYNNLHKKMRTVKLDRYLLALTTFKTRLGRNLVKKLIREYPDIFMDDTDIIMNTLKRVKIAGIGEKRREDVANSIPIFMKELYSLNKDDIKYAIDNQKKQAEKMKIGSNKMIKGKEFVFTGFMNKPPLDLEDYIWDNYGDIASTVTSNTEALICGNISNITPKMIQTQELSIPIYTLEEFIKIYDISLNMETHDIPED